MSSRRDGCKCIGNVVPPATILLENQNQPEICSKALAGAAWGTHQAAESGAVKPNLSCPNPLLGRRLLHLAHAGRYCMVCSARPKQPKRGHFEPFLTLGLVEIPDHEKITGSGEVSYRTGLHDIVYENPDCQNCDTHRVFSLVSDKYDQAKLSPVLALKLPRIPVKQGTSWYAFLRTWGEIWGQNLRKPLYEHYM